MVWTSGAKMNARGDKKSVAAAMAVATFVFVFSVGGQSLALAAEPADMSSAQASGVQEQLSRVAKEMIELSNKDPELQKGDVAKAREWVDKKVLPLLDKEELAKRATGRAWRDASPEQRSKLTVLVPQLLGKTYARALFDLKGAKVEFSPARVIDGVAKVAAKITPKSGQPVQLAFAATLGKDGQAQVQDIVIEGISLMGAFASNFASVVAKKGLDGLLFDLEAKVDR